MHDIRLPTRLLRLLRLVHRATSGRFHCAFEINNTPSYELRIEYSRPPTRTIDAGALGVFENVRVRTCGADS